MGLYEAMMLREALFGSAFCLIACTKPPEVPPVPTASAAVSAAVSVAPSTPSSSGLRFDIGAIDRTASPCVDFYDYACGGWRKTHPIPPDKFRWSRYAELEAENLDRERAIVEEAAQAGAGATPAMQRIGALYSACTDERGIEARGLEPIKSILARIDAIRTPADVMDVTAELEVHHVSVLLDAYPQPDAHDQRRMTLTLDSGSLGLHAREYAGDDSAALRTKYRAYLEQLFTAIGSHEAGAEADRVIAFETSLAKRALTPVQERDPDALDHPMTLAELHKRYGAIVWPKFFEKLGAPGVKVVNVAARAWLDAANEAILAKDLNGLRSYFRASVVHKYAIALPSAISTTVDDFDLKVVKGAHEVPVRWKRCLSLVDRMLGDDVGRVYLERHFSDDARRRANAMIESLRKAFQADLETLDWLSLDARKAALAKLGRLLVVVGGSNRLRTYDGLVMRSDDLFGDTWRARAFSSTWELAPLGAPTDRERFFDELPQSLDGFSAPPFVAVGFTAGFLQPPVFDPKMDDAVNFGGMGGVVGHELSHEFDDEGRKYDVDGNLHPWWSPEDIAHFEERAQCFIDEYAQFHAEEGTALDGKLTLGENIADNGGLRLSYAAARPSNDGPKIDGFTPAQRFFIAWGQIRCENVSPEAERRQVKTDGHSPGRWRVNGVVANMPEFAQAFSCAAGTPLAPAKRCRLW